MNAGNIGSAVDGENILDLIESHIDDSLDSSGNGIYVETTGEVKQLLRMGATKPISNNVGEFVDFLVKKGKSRIATILDMSEELGQPVVPPILPELTFNNFTDIYSKITTPIAPITPIDPPVHPLHHILQAHLGNAEYLTTTDIAITPDKTSLNYKIGGTDRGPINIIELCEDLYLGRKIEIKSMTQVAAKCQRAKIAAERKAERQNRLTGAGTSGSSSSGGNVPTQPNITANDELSPSILEAACNKAKATPGSPGYYGFDGEYFTIKYDKGTKFTAEYQDKEGNKLTTNGTDSATIVSEILKLAKKKEEKKDVIELDMGDEFDRHDLHDFYTEIHDAKKHKGVLTVHGRKFTIHYSNSSGKYELSFTDGNNHHIHTKGNEKKITYIIQGEVRRIEKKLHQLAAHGPEKGHAQEKTAGHEESGEKEKSNHLEKDHDEKGEKSDKKTKKTSHNPFVRAYTWTKNLVPKWIRKTVKGTRDSAVAGVAGSAVITGGLMAAAWVGLSSMPAVGAAGFFVPVAATIGVVTAGVKLYKAWKGEGDESEEESSKESVSEAKKH